LEDGDDIDVSATYTLWVLCVVVWVTLKLDIPCGWIPEYVQPLVYGHVEPDETCGRAIR
jgi:hypothetical protein